MKILAHTCFIGVTGYANHAKSFFCALNKYHTVKVRNSTIGGGWKGMNNTPHDNEPYITDEMKDMLILQTLINNDNSRSDTPIYGYKGDFIPDVHIVLVDTNNHYFYDNYEGYKIAYNVWESTRYPDNFFQRLHYFDEVWVPTQWQFDCLVEQGYPSHKISIVPEGVDVDTFKPLTKVSKKDKFRFLHFGRWDYRKGTTEVLRAFSETFKDRDDVELIASVENPYPFDGLKTTEDRVKHHNIDTTNIKFIKFTP
jgi:glycosyltransferase involved in cell wall biosynthesis